MEMLHLRYFVAVAEDLNFTAAARRLHMATSPLSQRIRDLEHELGQRLFDRDTHHVTLTQAGETLLPIARDILDQVNSIPWRLRESTGPRRETMFFGMPTGVHPDLRARVNTLAERVRDRIDLKRWPGVTPALIDAVRAGKLALTLARLPVGDPALAHLPVMSERMGVVVSAAQFAGRDSVALAELTDFTFVTAPPDVTPSYFDKLERDLVDRGIKKRVTLTSTDYSGVSEVISSGSAFSFSMLDEDSPMRGYRVADVVVLPVTDFEAHLDIGLVWRRDRADGGDLADLVDTAREVFADLLTR
nr:LysR family transcriptional regulator [Kibdelosporangium sp. MJ126-NF4]CEL13594.1 LysR-family transcriptional regulator [Kibdelosporangium sp. MJ126-NF4]CTQ99280.1 LysR-family transcriptional regulator [Kibdelosporangium sp. MJ126-NF4]